LVDKIEEREDAPVDKVRTKEKGMQNNKRINDYIGCPPTAETGVINFIRDIHEDDKAYYIKEKNSWPDNKLLQYKIVQNNEETGEVSVQGIP
jgi:hypothetical protein